MSETETTILGLNPETAPKAATAGVPFSDDTYVSDKTRRATVADLVKAVRPDGELELLMHGNNDVATIITFATGSWFKLMGWTHKGKEVGGTVDLVTGELVMDKGTWLVQVHGAMTKPAGTANIGIQVRPALDGTAVPNIQTEVYPAPALADARNFSLACIVDVASDGLRLKVECNSQTGEFGAATFAQVIARRIAA